MEFRAHVKSVKADLAKHELTLSFTVYMDEESLETAGELSQFTGEDAGPVELKVMPYQRTFLNKDGLLVKKSKNHEEE
jgi:hypothetical protein